MNKNEDGVGGVPRCVWFFSSMDIYALLIPEASEKPSIDIPCSFLNAEIVSPRVIVLPPFIFLLIVLYNKENKNASFLFNGVDRLS